MLACSVAESLHNSTCLHGLTFNCHQQKSHSQIFSTTDTYTDASVMHITLHFWCKVVLPEYLKCSCVSTFEPFRYAILTGWFAFVACLVSRQLLSSICVVHLHFRRLSDVTLNPSGLVSTHRLRQVMHPARDLFGRTLTGLTAPSAGADANSSIGSRCVAISQLSVGSADCLSQLLSSVNLRTRRFRSCARKPRT